MSRTFRSENNLKDGYFKKRHYKECYHTKKDKTPLEEDMRNPYDSFEYDYYLDGVYQFESSNIEEEMELCGYCGEYNPPNSQCTC